MDPEEIERRKKAGLWTREEEEYYNDGECCPCVGVVAGADDNDKAVDESSRWRSAESATLALPCQL
jgi:hypothetical protein